MCEHLLSSNRLFEPAQIIDIVKGLVVIGCAVPMCFMDISVVYHTVRAQAAIKLYMFFNMLEVRRRICLEISKIPNSRFVIVCYLPLVKTHSMRFIGLPLNLVVNTVLGNYVSGLLLPLFIVVRTIIKERECSVKLLWIYSDSCNSCSSTSDHT